jgi:dTDP-4-dehydrorhamnose 3,5-epimerase
MKWIETPIKDLFVLEIEPASDHRGFFARTYDELEFRKRGLEPVSLQCSTSYNIKKGTLRGMHFQAAPFEEIKVVRCTHGKVFDVVVDVRTDSPSYLKWFGQELSAENRKSFYIGKGLAHGFLTLEDHSEVYYHMSAVFDGPSSRGLRWNDPKIGISWPIKDPILSDRDATHPLL